MSYVIGIAGASGSGKSTLAKKLEKNFAECGLNVKYVKSVARSVIEEYKRKYLLNVNNIINTYYYSIFQYEVLKNYVSKYIEATAKYDVVIFDRTLYDIFLYHYYYAPLSPAYLMFIVYFGQISKMITYDFLILVQPSKRAVKDGVRDAFLSDRYKFYRDLSKIIIPNFTYDRSEESYEELLRTLESELRAAGFPLERRG